MGRREAGIGALAAALALGCGDSKDRQDGSGEDGVLSLGGSDGSGLGDGGGDKLDVAGGETEGNGGDCPGGMGGNSGEEYEFSYIWIANSPEGTVSKINTFTAIEEGRYLTGPGAPDPSRTSVNQFGDVAVANRGGGITKIAANEVGCIDQNMDGSIQTSTGPADVLAWGEDECVLWHTDLPVSDNALGPRPVAWEAVQSGGCDGNPRVWVGWWHGGAADVGEFWRLDGATGAKVDEVMVPDWNLGDKQTGPYGGAVNADGDFYVTGYYGPAIKIDAKTLDYEWFQPPDGSGFYGMALDTEENIWIGGCDGAIYHFEQASQSFISIATIDGRARGVQVDRDGRAWFAGNTPCRLLMVDVASKTLVEDAIPLPGCVEPVGVSIDVEGYVWVVDKDAQQAYKVHPETFAIEATVTGLVNPYTYSDMTGAGLGLVANPPAG